MNEESRLNTSLDLEYIFNNYIKARSSSNSKTRHRAYTLLHTSLLADMTYLETNEYKKEVYGK
jgi:hypothetical protein